MQYAELILGADGHGLRETVHVQSIEPFSFFFKHVFYNTLPLEEP